MKTKFKGKSKVIAFILTLAVLISTTGFNFKEASNIDQNLLKDDFYTAVNKNWLSLNQLKEGQFAVSDFTETGDKISEYTTKVFDNLLKKKATFSKDSTEMTMIDFYESFMNDEDRNKNGIKPLQVYLDKLKKVGTINELNLLLRDSDFSLFNSLFAFSVFQDMQQDSTKNALFLSPPVGFSLESNESTNDPIEKEKKQKINYLTKTYYSNVLALTGNTTDECTKKIDNILKFDEMLLSFTKNTTSLDNVYTIKELGDLAPNLKLPNTIKYLGYDKAPKIIVTTPDYFKNLNNIYVDDNINLIKDYLEINIIASLSNYLPDEFVNATSDFYNKIFSTVFDIKTDASTKPIRENLVAINLNSIFEGSIANLFIKDHFTTKDKMEVEILIKQIVNEYKTTLTNTDILSKETKKNAIKKLDNLKVDMGYSNTLNDYSDLKFVSHKNGGSPLQNYVNCLNFQRQNDIDSLTLKPTSVYWKLVGPLTVNAGYMTISNTMHFPVGILLPPYFDKNRDKEENLGTLGFIIAHEISHAFDLNGSEYDEHGKLNNWWTDKDRQNFNKRSDKIKNFYSKIEYLPNRFLNGELTLNENIADIGAMSCVLNILKGMENPNYKKFFESYARLWRQNISDEALLRLLDEDVHSPNKARVNAVIQQFEKFYKVYNIKKDNKMYVDPKDRLKVW